MNSAVRLACINVLAILSASYIHGQQVPVNATESPVLEGKLPPARVSGGVMAGSILTKIQPVYPPIAKAAHVTGAVTLHAVISKTGTVKDLKVISGPPMLQAAALDAVKQWTYKPYRLNGVPTEVETTVAVNFNFAGAPAPPLVTEKAMSEAGSLEPEPLKNRAVTGDLAAIFELAWRYRYGVRGVDKDLAQADALDKAAFPRLFTAAQAGEAYSQFLLGITYFRGNGATPADQVQAAAWMTKAADQGLPTAIGRLAIWYGDGSGVAKDMNRAIELLKKAADAGDLPSEVTLANLYNNGNLIPKDEVQARSWFHKAAEQGDASAQAWYGAMLRDGKGGPANPQEAAGWFRRAADQNFPDGVMNLAQLYLKGIGVGQDYSQAMAWYRLAANQGSAQAQEWVGAFYRDGTGVPVDFTEARVWFRKAAAQGSANAKTLLADLDQRVAQQNAAKPQPAQQQVAQQKPPADPNTNPAFTDWQNKVDNLTNQIQMAEQEAANNDALAASYATNAQNTDDTNTGAGAMGGLIMKGVNWGAAGGYKRAASKARKRANQLRAELAKMNAAQPPRITSANNGNITGMIAANGPTPGVAPNSGIQDATNQQLANIQAKQAQAAQAQAAAQKAAAQQAAAQQAAAQKAAAANAHAAPQPNLVSQNSGTAPPPTCVDLGPGNCMPIAQYQQLQAQKNQQGVVLDTLCPASGFVPGVMTHPSPDVALGVQCKPGSAIYINGVPQFDTTGTGLGPVTRTGPGSSTNGSGSGGGSVNSTDGQPEAGCIQLSSDPTNTYPVFHNTCTFAVRYFWTPFTIPPGGYAEQNGILQPGETQTGAETAVGGYRVYACQTNYNVVGPDGTPITKVVNGFRCVKPS
jgi:TonB family protein